MRQHLGWFNKFINNPLRYFESEGDIIKFKCKADSVQRYIEKKKEVPGRVWYSFDESYGNVDVVFQVDTPAREFDMQFPRVRFGFAEFMGQELHILCEQAIKQLDEQI